jgi:hypothetical protein
VNALDKVIADLDKRILAAEWLKDHGAPWDQEIANITLMTLQSVRERVEEEKNENRIPRRSVLRRQNNPWLRHGGELRKREASSSEKEEIHKA